MMQFTFGVFLTALVESFQSDRGTLSAALMMGLCATGIATPVAGWLVDRYGVRRITLPAVLLSGSGMVALGWLPNSSTKFVALYGVVGLVWGGQTPLPYARAVAGAFDRRRGLALGIAMTGVGLGAALIPLLAAHLLASFG
ncbi:MFS transporter [Bradyrhizobium jicamae]|nr:MFS transporter [Bradyrhizobium jicamae]MBR0755736.1 MFS transporter [Bradyrhizobium jicamae]